MLDSFFFSVKGVVTSHKNCLAKRSNKGYNLHCHLKMENNITQNPLYLDLYKIKDTKLEDQHPATNIQQPGPEFIKKNSCSTQLSRKFFLLINVKMPTIVGISTFMSKKNSSICLSEPEKC